MDEQSLALCAIILPEEAAIVEKVDKRLEEEIGKMQKQEVDVKRVALGRKLYFLFVRYGVMKKIDAVTKLAGNGLIQMISPEMLKRINVSATLIQKDTLFEKVGGRRYPIGIDMNSDSPLSVRLVF